jgi:predicted proteasome-type protease
MTYCLAIALEEGLVFCSDSRTNAGPDRVSKYSKMHRFSMPYERSMVILTAGNLATSQAVIAQLQRDLEEDTDVNIFNARYVRNSRNTPRRAGLMPDSTPVPPLFWAGRSRGMPRSCT